MHKQVREARQVRDAEAADPGVVRRTFDANLEAGQGVKQSRSRRSVVSAMLGIPFARGRGLLGRR